MNFLKTVSAATFVTIALFGSATAQANIISGRLWHVSNAIAPDAIVANVPGTAPDATFDVMSPLNFNATGSILEFTGFVTVTHNETFTVTHDDGLTLIIGGMDLGFSPGPTSPVMTTATYTGPTGTFAFTLVYGECCSGYQALALP